MSDIPDTATANLEVRSHTAIASVNAEDWDACANTAPNAAHPSDPFTTHRFLAALEHSKSVGPGTGWQPHYLTVHSDGLLIACAPLFAKFHSQGEYVFDFAWAEAFERAGGAYYPKLQCAVPFTPVTGRRLLARPGFETVGRAALIQAIVQIAADNDLSSAHITFCNTDEATAGETMGLMRRIGQQYHWFNDDYADFSAFLDTLSSRKRKAIRKERRTASEAGLEFIQLTGDAITPDHWDAFWSFYQDTGARKWGTPYLTRAFFDIAQETLRDDILLILALDQDRPVAGALNFIGQDAIFGRYWGATAHHPCLHFELCYYQAIDYAIAQGLSRVEAGAQGDHKLARGYLPVTTQSLHWIADAGFRDAVHAFVANETDAINDEIDALTEMGPFKRSPT